MKIFKKLNPIYLGLMFALAFPIVLFSEDSSSPETENVEEKRCCHHRSSSNIPIPIPLHSSEVFAYSYSRPSYILIPARTGIVEFESLSTDSLLQRVIPITGQDSGNPSWITGFQVLVPGRYRIDLTIFTKATDPGNFELINGLVELIPGRELLPENPYIYRDARFSLFTPRVPRRFVPSHLDYENGAVSITWIVDLTQGDILTIRNRSRETLAMNNTEGHVYNQIDIYTFQ